MEITHGHFTFTISQTDGLLYIDVEINTDELSVSEGEFFSIHLQDLETGAETTHTVQWSHLQQTDASTNIGFQAEYIGDESVPVTDAKTLIVFEPIAPEIPSEKREIRYSQIITDL